MTSFSVSPREGRPGRGPGRTCVRPGEVPADPGGALGADRYPAAPGGARDWSGRSEGVLPVGGDGLGVDQPTADGPQRWELVPPTRPGRGLDRAAAEPAPVGTASSRAAADGADGRQRLAPPPAIGPPPRTAGARTARCTSVASTGCQVRMFMAAASACPSPPTRYSGLLVLASCRYRGGRPSRLRFRPAARSLQDVEVRARRAASRGAGRHRRPYGRQVGARLERAARSVRSCRRPPG